MRRKHEILSSVLSLTILLSIPALGDDMPGAKSATAATPAAATASAATVSDPLLHLLVIKGVLSVEEANSLGSTSMDKKALLLSLLREKGILSEADYVMLAGPATAPAAGATEPALALASAVQAQTAPGPQTPTPDARPAVPSVVAAVAPLRVLPVDPPIKDGLNAAFKMGPVKMTPYGFIKATAAYDSSSPNGDDFPFVGIFLSSTQAFSTGPTTDPEFHLKARSTRVGANIEWPDISPKLVLTGRVEGDYEGNFSEVDNRDVSSIRSSSFQLRLAYVRMDYNASDKTDFYFEGGQDWTIFGSTALPNMFETTFLGAYYGNIWERSPQFQIGMVQKLSPWHNLKFSPTFAIMMPSSGEIEKLGSLGLQGQIGQAEREGADSGRPEVEGRAVIQWQLDSAKGVAPAQIIFSGVQGRRTSLVPNTAPGYSAMPANYLAAFPNGFSASSNLYGGQFALQLPTRWATFTGSVYRGGDLRFFFGGQVNSYATDIGGLTNIQGAPGFQTLDGGPLAAAGGAVLGTNSAGQVVVAPQRAIRSFGGFANIGLPLSRWFNADPHGHNAGWQLYFDVGKDQVVDRDLNNANFSSTVNILSPLPLSMGKSAFATLYYKLNPYCTFGFEQSIYASRVLDGLPLYTIAGHPSNEWQDHRTEFGPTFTF